MCRYGFQQQSNGGSRHTLSPCNLLHYSASKNVFGHNKQERLAPLVLFLCNRFLPTPTTVQRLHILLLATVMTVHPYILQQILAYRYYYIHTGYNRYKKNTRCCGCGCFLFWCSADVLAVFCVVAVLLLLLVCRFRAFLGCSGRVLVLGR